VQVIPAFLKKIIKKLPVDFTVNQRYDRQTRKVIEAVCNNSSNCIDVGCHKGEILDVMLRTAPSGNHYAFEPIPFLFENLVRKYRHRNVHIYRLALSNETGKTSFNYVVSNPAYSGLKKRTYDRPKEKDEMIQVDTAKLDDIIPENLKIDLIKIDVEGGELQVLEGGVSTISRCKPVIIFEHGLGASEFYGSSPEKIFSLLHTCGLNISLMKNWLNGENGFNVESFKEEFYKRKNFVFIAYP
jgi:FkbM family methyltransferase